MTKFKFIFLLVSFFFTTSFALTEEAIEIPSFTHLIHTKRTVLAAAKDSAFSELNHQNFTMSSKEVCPFALEKNFVKLAEQLKASVESLVNDYENCGQKVDKNFNTEEENKIITTIDSIIEMESPGNNIHEEVSRGNPYFESRLSEINTYETEFLKMIAQLKTEGTNLSEIANLVDFFNSSIITYVDKNFSDIERLSLSKTTEDEYFSKILDIEEAQNSRKSKSHLLSQLILYLSVVSTKVNSTPKVCLKQTSIAKSIGNLVSQSSMLLSTIPGKVGAVASIAQVISTAVTNLISNIDFLITNNAISEIEEIIAFKSFECIYWNFEQIHCSLRKEEQLLKDNAIYRMADYIYDKNEIKEHMTEYWTLMEKTLQNVALISQRIETQSQNSLNGFLLREEELDFIEAKSYFENYNELYENLKNFKFPALENYSYEYSLIQHALNLVNTILSFNENKVANFERQIRTQKFSDKITAKIDNDAIFLLIEYESNPMVSNPADMEMRCVEDKDTGQEDCSQTIEVPNSIQTELNARNFFDLLFEIYMDSSNKDDFISQTERLYVHMPVEITWEDINDVFYEPVQESSQIIQDYFNVTIEPLLLNFLELFKDKEFSVIHIGLITFLSTLDFLENKHSLSIEDIDTVFKDQKIAILTYLIKHDYYSEIRELNYSPAATLDILGKLQAPLQNLILKPLVSSMVQTLVNIYGKVDYWKSISRYWGHIFPDLSLDKSLFENYIELVSWKTNLLISPANYASAWAEILSAVFVVPSTQHGYYDEDEKNKLREELRIECILFGNLIANDRPRLWMPELNQFVYASGTDIYNTLCNNEDLFQARYEVATDIRFDGTIETYDKIFNPMEENICKVFDAETVSYLISF
ncbi:MAG: hypothetical protein ABIA04_07650 [Pseudomonadota bacterium]